MRGKKDKYNWTFIKRACKTTFGRRIRGFKSEITAALLAGKRLDDFETHFCITPKTPKSI
jgi:hypothetical protein